MSIVTLKRVTLVGLTADKDRVLERLQDLGCLHLEPLHKEGVKAEEKPEMESYRKVLRFLGDCPQQCRQLSEDPGFDPKEFVERCLALAERIRSLSDRCDFLRARIRVLEPWGGFRFPPDQALAGYKLWFYMMPAGRLKHLPREELAWQVVRLTPRFAYVVVIARKEPPPERMPVPRTHTGKIPLARLMSELERYELALEDCQAERARLTRWLTLFRRHLLRLEDMAARSQAAAGALDAAELFALQGWIPEVRRSSLTGLARREGLALTEAAPESEETPPTLLQNRQPFQAGESLVTFYQTPHYHDWDPTAVTFVSFVAFFALMLSDAGYALLLSALLALTWRRWGNQLRTLILAASVTGLGWGVVAGSYFGHSPSPDSLAAYLKVVEVNDFDAMMQLAVLIGVLHLSFGNLCRARQHWRRSEAGLEPVGWTLAVWGGFIWWQVPQAGSALHTTALVLLGIGLASVFLGGGRRVVETPADLVMRLLEGVGTLTGVTRLFGDVLSYLRLFALGLASTSLASTFNELAGQVGGVAGIGLLAGILVLLLGHGINFPLALLGGVIHGMRLNCLEFFNWALSGEGRPFRAFAKKEKTLWNRW